MIIDPTVQATNQNILNGIVSEDTSIQKKAAEGLSGYLRLRAKEDGFTRSILSPIKVNESNLDRQVDSVKPTIVRDMEPNSPPAYSVPFGTVPLNKYMDAPRYRIMFDRVMSDRFIGDVENLLTYDMDIKQVFNELMLKDILAEEDRKFIALVDSICGTLDSHTSDHVTDCGSIGYVSAGAMDRAALAFANKCLAVTDKHLPTACALVNNVTIWDVVALAREDVGGDLAEDLFTNGYTVRNIMGVKWIVTIKTDLVATSDAYFFAAPKYLGDFCILRDITVSNKNENFMFEMFAYETIGMALKNAGAMAKVKFAGTQGHWLPSEG